MTGTIEIGRFHLIVLITLEASSAGSSANSGVTIIRLMMNSQFIAIMTVQYDSRFFASVFRFWFDFCTSFPGCPTVKSESRTL